MYTVLEKLLLFTSILWSSCSGLKMLYVVPCQSGHFNPAAGVVRSLLSRDHQVDLLVGDNCCKKVAESLGENLNCEFMPIFPVATVVTKGPLEMIAAPVSTEVFATNGTLGVFNYVNNYLDRHPDYDVIMHDYIFTGTQVAASVRGIPTVNIYVGALMLPVASEPYEGCYLVFFPETRLPDFVQELFNSVGWFFWHKLVSQPVSQAIKDLQAEHGISSPWKERGIDFSLPVSFHYHEAIIVHMGPPDLTLPNLKFMEYENNVYHVGFVPDKEYLKTLDQDLEHFIANSKRPIAYMSLGTVFELPERELKELLNEVASQDKVSMIWSAAHQFYKSLKSQGFENENLMLVTKIPQLSLLMHEKVKVFITHTGANSLQEGVYAEKPMLVYPGFGDQPINARRVVFGNMGLPLVELTAVEFSRKLDMILEPKMYAEMKRNLDQSRRLMEKLGGFESAANIVEKVARKEIRVRNAPKLYNLIDDAYYSIYIATGVFLSLLTVTFLFTAFFCCRRANKSKRD